MRSLLMLLMTACFNPAIGPGEYRCGPAGACPEALECCRGWCQETFCEEPDAGGRVRLRGADADAAVLPLPSTPSSSDAAVPPLPDAPPCTAESPGPCGEALRCIECQCERCGGWNCGAMVIEGPCLTEPARQGDATCTECMRGCALYCE